ncbi:alpha-L-fucosidase [Streptomyces sp. TRM66268-LWL]|uniref:alpha-L-fucosidase n=1 Tax=Streptomyces polyasparticus TaxID=2767826 RepID=A0ABR7SMZ5_9ACTN|nr:alpha-L-fucosidase [Streptomyces polyasparticus]MBC9715748.1 alpha-L-fucosidase [Streptomyces polyasparticus]
MSLSRRLFVGAVAASSTSYALTAGAGPANAASAGTASASAAPAEAYYRIPISTADTPEQLVAKAARVRPTERQITWQRLEKTAFLHFGVNTFTGLEWGTGDEDPKVFQPVGLDTDQWARALRDGGFKLAILTVKHHDGFVLYPSRYTRHSVVSSSWQDGRGDVLRSFADSMRRHGIKVGVYVSPADENQYLHGVYANGSARTTHTVPTLTEGDDRAGEHLRTFELQATDYGAYMLNQLHEVLTEYGPIDEVWFDGAQGRIPPDKVERYDWDSWYQLVRTLAPDATIAVSGPDVRWVGNEGGLAREDEWSVVPVQEKDYGRTDYALHYEAADQGSRAALVGAQPLAQYLQWWPAECDVSIRPGWFFHADQQPKTVEQLTDIWFRSVGRNAVLLLNIPPNQQGRLPDADVAVLREFRERTARELPDDLARGSRASGDGHRPVRAVDGDPDTAWAAPAPSKGTLTLDLGREQSVDRIRLAEDIRRGQQVESAVVEARTAEGWQQVAAIGTIGASRILALPTMVTARQWRLRIVASREAASIAAFELHRSRV